MNLLAKINSFFPSLTKSEQKVAQFILANPDKIEVISIQELAKQAKVGESTIVRFTRKIGFDGYQQFKLELVKNQLREALPYMDEKKGDSWIVQQQLQEILINTQQFLNEQEEKLNCIAENISKAECIYLFAVGNSGTLAADCANRFIRIGKKAIFHSDSHIQAINASVMTNKDVAFAITVSGNTKDVLLNLNIASETGAFLAAITNYSNSSVTNLTENALVCSPKEYSSVYVSFASKVSQMYTMDVLFRKIVDLDKEKIQSLRNKTNNALIDRLI
ncbi:uncharacterized HTH-type transcriptional regulator (plasmid) [Carnobacterium sp. 17-4]|uniref:MurR/RpiR family transcriptional regulator n=1 Tax=Carnobacterium sp. (strain 17-4) TaxID=208596 RepID=UPI0002058487|nr:MurR/RpiR family transcriptional regulator [Carnobacterium sp. 17-4]AEB31185.1 uncharacterized HTH-type transcriptional regulator [Carnobacterium sp. 17-4]